MNFHGDIAISIEEIACKELGWDGRPGGTIFDADSIESGCFYESMIALLRIKYVYYKYDVVEEFARKYAEYYCKPASEIPEKRAEWMFQDFKQLYDAAEIIMGEDA